MEYIRFPLRLGNDVFLNGEISAEKESKFIKLMQTFKNLLELYEVDDYMFCATSAMREARNGRDIAYKVKDLLGVEIQIIDGDEEANMINKVLLNELEEGTYIHVDVGGGSTEVNIFIDKKKVASRSFRIGTVRILDGKDTPEEWETMKRWVEENTGMYEEITAIGTGGNIGKIYELSEVASSKRRPKISLKTIKNVQTNIEKLNYEERVHVLMLNPDRADVIIPASNIYTSIMKWAGAKKMVVPEVGLKDGLMLTLYERSRNREEPILSIENINKFQK